jgi:hypothetical protein
MVAGIVCSGWCKVASVVQRPSRQKKKKKSSTVVAVGVRVLVAGCDDWHVLWWPECSVVAGKVAAAIGKKFPAI